MDVRPVVAVLVVCLAFALVVPVQAGGAAATSEQAMQASGAGGGSGGAASLDTLRLAASSGNLGRADTEGVLDQPTRAAVYEAIETAPGRSLSAIAAAVGVTKSTVEYHVDVLREAGLVAGTVVAGTRRFAPAGTDAELAGTLRADATAAMLEAVAAEEPASVTAVAEATDRAASTVSHHLSRLAERGLVERKRAGEAVLTSLAPATRRALADDPAPADD
ncbi:winged helix-turn-helix transcriptional regulator [Natronomonas marina]|jgi:DNA-binding transcriptional ArsR family regulator|uniref:winged helix-turn-helix transcriptional regulator n=1 Tax=Natronomonas marina TaxID=2961939 RepID=UPI0020CA1AC4|nr:helix-turn-helix domain-containing protein [Natronomonas marina]